jgi:alpha-L-rhamnosidase
MEDKESPPVEHIRVVDCTFNRGYGVVTLGSEATVVRNVVVENCTVNGSMSMAKMKLRGDTPQQYEDVHYRNITLNSSGGMIVVIQPWSQYFDLQGQTPPHSIVRNVTLSNIKGYFGAFGNIEPNRGQTEISDITLENFAVQLKKDKLKASGVRNFKFTNVNVNGTAYVP